MVGGRNDGLSSFLYMGDRPFIIGGPRAEIFEGPRGTPQLLGGGLCGRVFHDSDGRCMGSNCGDGGDTSRRW